jgi:hypothetical protein
MRTLLAVKYRVERNGVAQGEYDKFSEKIGLLEYIIHDYFVTLLGSPNWT